MLCCRDCVMYRPVMPLMHRRVCNCVNIRVFCFYGTMDCASDSAYFPRKLAYAVLYRTHSAAIVCACSVPDWDTGQQLAVLGSDGFKLPSTIWLVQWLTICTSISMCEEPGLLSAQPGVYRPQGVYSYPFLP